jgi:hypothetical protein
MIKFSFKGFSPGSIFKAYSQTYDYKLKPTPVFPIVEESVSSPGYPLEGHTKRKTNNWIQVDHGSNPGFMINLSNLSFPYFNSWKK